MKNKKNIYILLPIVLFVWGCVLYQVFSLARYDEGISTENNFYTIKPLQIKARQKFTIDITYRDPFLGKMYVSEKGPQIKTKSSNVNRPIKPKETVVWPSILYKGLISDSKENKKQIFILIIDGKNYYMKIGDTQEGVFLKTGDRESVYVKYKANLNLIMLQD